MLIYKIFRRPEWQTLRKSGHTKGAPIDMNDGYIHLSTAEQAPETAALHFKDQDDLFLVALEADDLGAALKWEASRGGALFPHLYRDLKLDDVIWAQPLPLAGGMHQFPARPGRGIAVTDAHVDPDRAQFDAFKALDRDVPLDMLNLVSLRDLANYPGDHELARDGLTGAEAYRLYAQYSAPVLARVGGGIAWRGAFDLTLIGPQAEAWDIMFIAQYPNAHAFLAMLSDPEYKRAVVHRQAAVRTSRLIRSRGLPVSDAFG